MCFHEGVRHGGERVVVVVVSQFRSAHVTVSQIVVHEEGGSRLVKYDIRWIGT